MPTESPKNWIRFVQIQAFVNSKGYRELFALDEQGRVYLYLGKDGGRWERLSGDSTRETAPVKRETRKNGGDDGVPY